MRLPAVARWLAATALACATQGCLHRRGDWSAGEHAVAEPTRAGVKLVVLGNAGWAGAGAAKVAREVDRVLADAHAGPSSPIVLWLGNNVMARRGDRRRHDCREARRAWTRPGVGQLAEAVRAHLARGHASYAVAGEQDWRCGSAPEQRQLHPDEHGHPWQMPAAHYVVRILGDGRSEIASTCDDGTCRLADRDEQAPALAELVMIDATAWLHRDAMAESVGEQMMRELTSLLEALDADRDIALPRILVTHFPVEAAGWHGQGGGAPDSTWPTLPRSLRQALAAGSFVGVVAAHDHGVYADADISDAVKRSDRVWLPAPLFQIVSGGASARAGGPRRMRHFGSVTLVPDLYAPDLGFAVVDLDPARIEVTLHARRVGRWTRSRLSFPLHRPPHPHETLTPAMSPCLRCAEVPANERP